MTTPVENKRRTEIDVVVKEKIVAFFIGGAGDKRRFKNCEATSMSKWFSWIGERHVDSRAANAA